MKRFELFVTLSVLLLSITGNGAALNPGDIAIIGFHSDAPDQFAWVTLVDLSPGLEITFTDAGFTGGGYMGENSSSDGAIIYIVPPGGISAGKVQLVILQEVDLQEGYKAVDVPGLGPRMLAGKFGDQCAAFSGDLSDSSFLFAINTNSSSWIFSANPSTESDLYPGLVNGQNAVALGISPAPGDEVDNAVYEGITKGTRDELLSSIADESNWRRTDDPIYDITNGTLVPGFEIIVPGLFIRSDVNMDTLTDIGDAVTILTYLFGNGVTLPCEDAADVNDDGKLDISDTISLLSYLFASGLQPKTPYPDCGIDPTDDGLTCEIHPGCY